jgi:hypothetical protein
MRNKGFKKKGFRFQAELIQASNVGYIKNSKT